jgi:hypothetical protein
MGMGMGRNFECGCSVRRPAGSFADPKGNGSGNIVIVDCRANMEEIFREGGMHFRDPVLSGKMSTKRRIIENK